MTNIAIKVENLSKRYRIGLKEEMHDTLVGAMKEFIRRPFTNLRRLRQLSTFSENGREPDDVLWALRDVSFEVKQGEVVGIIGRNGAGKSTLLKILSRITYPTSGRVEMQGRVSSLLEVGTGFHPELTGRENIYLNGTILGMRKAEVDRKFDEILAFSGVEKFVDTPIKWYSSGMKVRLAFSVSAYLEPEILLVDEVLAVGDAEFQEKCLGKLSEVAKGGRTVLFVSHNLAAIRSLCHKGLLIDDGRLSAYSGIGEVIYEYLQKLDRRKQLSTNEPIQFLECSVSSHRDRPIHISDEFELQAIVNIRNPLLGSRLFCIIEDESGQIVVHARTDANQFAQLTEQGLYTVNAQFPALWLRPGVYTFHFKLMANAVTTGKGRFVSDPHMLDINGNIPSEMLLGSLTPPIGWTISSEG